MSCFPIGATATISTATRSPDAPTTAGCFQPKFSGGQSEMLVAKHSPDLQRLIWCSYVGGSGEDSPRGGLTLDEQDCVYVVGTSNSPNFPTTPGVFPPQLNGPRDSAIVKLKADGSGPVFSTRLGGSGEDDAIMGVRLDAAGNVYVAGHAKSRNFPGDDGSGGRVAVQPKGVKVRDLGYRWGSCGKDDTLYLHWRVILLPPVRIEYLVLHELCHLHEHDHSEAFFERLRRAAPDYRAHDVWLRAHGDDYRL